MAEKFDLKEARNRLVAKDNRLIQNSRYALEINENKAVLYLISKIQPEDEPGKLYTFNCKEFQSLIGWTKDASYKKIKVMLTKLSDMRWWIDLDNGEESLVRWFHIIRMNPGTDEIKITFHEDMFPFLVQLQQRLDNGQYFTSYKLQYITLMKNRYSPRLYEILKSYQFNNKKWTFENGTGSQYDIQRMICDTVLDAGSDKGKSIIPKNWSNWALFKRDVLEPAVKEINKYTDIKVAYEGKKEDIRRKKTRAIRSIEFYMVGKTGPEQRNTDEVIDAEYKVFEDYHQYSMDELSVEEEFFKAHDESLKEEKIENERIERERIALQADNSKYPVLFGILNNERKANLDEKKIRKLYEAATVGRVAGVIDARNWELFATDLVDHYYKKIEATSEDTKSTLYKRLLNYVEKDYDGIVYELLERYSR